MVCHEGLPFAQIDIPCVKCAEMWEDVKRWISPLRNHPGLHSEFLSYATKKFKNLEDLMTKVSDSQAL